MALPHLVKYIYNNGSDEVVRRGKIHSLGYVEMIEHDELTGNIFLDKGRQLQHVLQSKYSKICRPQTHEPALLLPVQYWGYLPARSGCIVSYAGYD